MPEKLGRYCKGSDCNPIYHQKCSYERCDTSNLHGGTGGYCGAHYRQLRKGETVRPVRGSRYFWEAQLNDKGEKRCSRCDYWYPITEFHVRHDGSRVNEEFGRSHCKRCHILRRMNMTARDFDELWSAQGGGCAICGRTENSTRDRGFAVDHNHACCPGGGSCGECVRGILCDACNVMIARAGDKPDVLRKAADYLTCPVR